MFDNVREKITDLRNTEIGSALVEIPSCVLLSILFVMGGAALVSAWSIEWLYDVAIGRPRRTAIWHKLSDEEKERAGRILRELSLTVFMVSDYYGEVDSVGEELIRKRAEELCLEHNFQYQRLRRVAKFPA